MNDPELTGTESMRLASNMLVFEDRQTRSLTRYSWKKNVLQTSRPTIEGWIDQVRADNKMMISK